MKTFILTTTAVVCMAASQASWADRHENNPCMPPMPHKEGMANTSEAERKAFHEERKAEWQGLSEAEKLEVIEGRRQERIQTMESHWQSLTDEQKISCAQKQMEKRKEGRKGGPRS